MKFIYYLVIYSLLIVGCSKKEECPPDVYLGSLSLIDSSRYFLPYQGKHFLKFVGKVFVDTVFLDSTAILYSQASLIQDSNKTVIANICHDPDNNLRSDTFYLSEHKTVDFFDQDTSRKFRVFGNLSIVEDYLSTSSTVANPVLFDELKLTVHRSNPSISGAVATIEFVASDRNNKDRMSDSLKARIQRFNLIPQIQIDTFIHRDVYEYRNNDSIYFYFKPLVGVVAFRDLNNNWWNLLSAN